MAVWVFTLNAYRKYFQEGITLVVMAKHGGFWNSMGCSKMSAYSSSSYRISGNFRVIKGSHEKISQSKLYGPSTKI